ncbi:MAG: flagellar hook-length control protein FliK [Rhabdaerophilum sp.]
MPEIASLSPLLGIDFSNLPEPAERGRRGDKDVTPFGQLVSEQARPTQANGQGQPPVPVHPMPAPLERPVEKPATPPKSRASRPTDQDEPQTSPATPAEDKPSAPPAETRVQRKEHQKTSDDTVQKGQSAEVADKEVDSSTVPADTPVAELTEAIEAAAIEVEAEAIATPVEVTAEHLNEAVATAVPVPADPSKAPAVLLAAMAETPSATASKPDAEAEAVIAALGSATGEARKTTAMATSALLSEAPAAAAAAEAPAPSAAETFAKITARMAETPVATRAAGGEAPAKAPAAADLPKANFGDWIHDFALSQGAHHRSGDLVGSLDRAISAVPTPNLGQDALRPTPLQMLPIEIGMQAMRGVTKFQIRLDPAELGRVDVQLEIKEDGQVKANLVVDRVETLAMLKRDASTLQQAFEQAGLRQSADGLQFSLRGEGQQREGQRDGEPRRNWTAEDEKLMGELPQELALRRVMIPHSSLDLMV